MSSLEQKLPLSRARFILQQHANLPGSVVTIINKEAGLSLSAKAYLSLAREKKRKKNRRGKQKSQRIYKDKMLCYSVCNHTNTALALKRRNLNK